jgi:hypothetical protein
MLVHPAFVLCTLRLHGQARKESGAGTDAVIAEIPPERNQKLK